jgi:hypothetical protein
MSLTRKYSQPAVAIRTTMTKQAIRQTAFSFLARPCVPRMVVGASSRTSGKLSDASLIAQGEHLNETRLLS